MVSGREENIARIGACESGLTDRIEILDGATGTLLERYGIRLRPPLWSASAIDKAPELLGRVHADYVAAGATLITANTFRTNPRSVMAAGHSALRAASLTKQAVEIARTAIDAAEGEQATRLAASVAPVGDCYHPSESGSVLSLRADHEAHVENIVDAAVDVILVETMNGLDEAVLVASIVAETEHPFLVSLVTDTSGEALLDGTPLSIAIRQIAAYRPEAILTNCASPAASVMAVQILAEESKLAEAAWGVGSYPNSSAPDPVEGWARVSTVTDEAFDRSIAEMLRAGAGYVGSCCGTGPETTERIVRMVRALAGETGSS